MTKSTASVHLSLILLVGAAGIAAASDARAHDVQRQTHCMALAIYWEARGEGPSGMRAVGWTILNRVFSAEFPSTPCGVVYEGGETPPCQFSWYCDGKSDRPRDWHGWQHAMEVATQLLSRPPEDPTGGALYYHSVDVKSRWHASRVRLARIGRHVFYQ